MDSKTAKSLEILPVRNVHISHRLTHSTFLALRDTFLCGEETRDWGQWTVDIMDICHDHNWTILRAE